MTPFALQAEMTRQWLGFAEALAGTMLSAYATTGHEAVAASTATSHPMHKTAIAAIDAPTHATPADADGQSFGPFSPLVLWAQIFSLPTSLMAGVPFTLRFPPAFWPFQIHPGAPWGLTGKTLQHKGARGSSECAGASYRTASGYATAVVMGPSDGLLAPRNLGKPE